MASIATPPSLENHHRQGVPTNLLLLNLIEQGGGLDHCTVVHLRWWGNQFSNRVPRSDLEQTLSEGTGLFCRTSAVCSSCMTSYYFRSPVALHQDPRML